MSQDELECEECGSSAWKREFSGSGQFNRTNSRHVGGEAMHTTRVCINCGNKVKA